MTAPLLPLRDLPRVTLDIVAADASEAILKTASGLSGHPAISDHPGFCRDLLEREALSSTAAGHGLAFPHARTRRTSELVMAVGRCAQPVKFAGDQEVQLIFVLGAPTGAVREYLALFAALTRRLRDSGVRDSLLTAANEEEFLRALTGGGAPV